MLHSLFFEEIHFCKFVLTSYKPVGMDYKTVVTNKESESLRMIYIAPPELNLGNLHRFLSISFQCPRK